MARPRLKLDAELIAELAKAQLTNPEIATICKCSEDTLTRRFAVSLKLWKQEGVGSVRRRLFQSAIGQIKEANQTTAMIFFLKNYGGMKDQVEHTGTIKHERPELEQLSAVELEEVARLVESAAISASGRSG